MLMSRCLTRLSALQQPGCVNHCAGTILFAHSSIAKLNKVCTAYASLQTLCPASDEQLVHTWTQLKAALEGSGLLSCDLSRGLCHVISSRLLYTQPDPQETGSSAGEL